MTVAEVRVPEAPNPCRIRMSVVQLRWYVARCDDGDTLLVITCAARDAEK